MQNKEYCKKTLLAFLIFISHTTFGQNAVQNIDLFAEYNVNDLMPNKDGTYSIYGYNTETKTRFLTRINNRLQQEWYKQVEMPGYKTLDLRSSDALFEPKQRRYYVAMWEYKRKPDEKISEFGSIPIQPLVFVYDDKGEYIEKISFNAYLHSTEKTGDKGKLRKNAEGDVYFFYYVEDTINSNKMYFSAYHINAKENRQTALFSINMESFPDGDSFDICVGAKDKFIVKGEHSVFILQKGQTELGKPLYKFNETRQEKYKSEIFEKWCYDESLKKLFLLKVCHKQPDSYGQTYSDDHSLLKLSFRNNNLSDLVLDKEIDLQSFKAFKRPSGTIITKDVESIGLVDATHIVMAIEKWTPTTTASKYHYSIISYNTNSDEIEKESELVRYLTIKGEISVQGKLAVNSKNDVLFNSKIYNYKSEPSYQHIFYWKTDSTLNTGTIANSLVKQEFERLQDNVSAANRRATLGSVAKDFMQAAPQALAAAYTVRMQNNSSQTPNTTQPNTNLNTNQMNIQSNSTSATSEERVGSLLKSYSEAITALNNNKNRLRYYDLEYEIINFLYGPNSGYNGGEVKVRVCKDHVDQYNFHIIKMSWGVIQYLLSEEPDQIPSIEDTIGESLQAAGQVHQHGRIGECGCAMCQKQSIDWEKYYIH